jgi:ATP synthase protein I
MRGMMSQDAQQGGSAGGGNGHGRPDGEGEGLEARLRHLEAELAKRQPKPEPADDERAASTGYAQAIQLSSEFVAAVIVGFALGYGLDYLLGTKPWGMIVFLLLGVCAGMLNVMRAAGLVAQPTVRRKDDADRIGRDDRPKGG